MDSTRRDELLDRDKLLALYRSTDGVNWDKNDNWDTDASVSRWHGVKVKQLGVSALNLGENSLRGTLPSEMWQMSELEGMWMYDNSLSGRIPELLEEYNLEKLNHLNLAGNDLTGRLPHLHLLPNLRHVYLGRNKLSGPIPEELGEGSRLWILDLSDNQLEGEIPQSLGRLQNLAHLRLYGNTGLTGPILNALVHIISLKEVIVNGCSFTGSLPPQLGDLVNLEKLILSSNKFSGEIPKEMAKMSKLKEFKVDGDTNLSLPGNAWNQRSEFYLWMNRIGITEYMEQVFPPYEINAPPISDVVSPFPEKGDHGGLLEGPVSGSEQDHLGFGDYADVLARRLSDSAVWPVGVGIYAQWGAGKSSLVELIIKGLKEKNVQATSRAPCLCRCLWMSVAGAVVAALCGGLVDALTRCCRKRPNPSQLPPDEEDGRRRKDVTSVVAKFDAWLYADSNALWALLISKIFEQMENHPCFGTGAVRATRVRHAIASSTCMEWCFVIVTALIMAGIGVAAGLAGEKIADLEQHLEQTIAGIALAGVPIAVMLWVVKMLPLVFVGEGQLILSKAKTMGESVGAAHLGFMAEVQEEMEILLGMLKDKSNSDDRNDYLLVVCVDNLDRCPHRQIVKVLEAVHLLLERAEVNVAVILALDPRVIIAAIEQDMGEGMRREVSGTEYLDKIIHWPFCIPFGTKDERLSLLHDWLIPMSAKSAAAAPTTQYGQASAGQQPLGPTVSNVTRDDHSRGGASLTTGIPHPSDPSAAADAIPAISTREEKVGESAVPAAEPRQTSRRQQPLGPAARSASGDRSSSDRPSSTTGVFRSSDQYAAADVIPPPPGGEEKLDGNAGSATAPWRTSGAQPAPSHDGAVQHGLTRQTSSQLHTAEEITELETMIKAIKTTPRKAKRVLNIYGIQRDLATKRAEARKRADEKNADFTRIDAKKLLRWTILSEFWPFHIACLLAVIRKQPATVRLADLFDNAGTKFIDSVLNGKRSTALAGETMMDSNRFSTATAGRRLMGMDEADEGFLEVLGSDPPLLVEDFDEDKLGLLRLSFNLNPAMVATVTAWRRALW